MLGRSHSIRRSWIAILLAPVLALSLISVSVSIAGSEMHDRAWAIYKIIATCSVSQEYDMRSRVAKILVLPTSWGSDVGKAAPLNFVSVGLIEVRDVQQLSDMIMEELKQMSDFVAFYPVEAVDYPAGIGGELNVRTSTRKLSKGAKEWMRDKGFSLAMWFETTKNMDGTQQLAAQVRDFRFDRCVKSSIISKEVARDVSAASARFGPSGKQDAR